MKASSRSIVFVACLGACALQQPSSASPADANVERDRTRPEGAGTLGPEGPYASGDAVVAIWSGSGLWYEAHVVQAGADGIAVQFDLDGVVEVVPAAKIRHRVGGSSPYVPGSGGTYAQDSGYQVGDAVSAVWDSTGSWYDGHVIAVNDDGSLLVRFDLDGIEQVITSPSKISPR